MLSNDEHNFVRDSSDAFHNGDLCLFGERFDIDTIGPLPKDDYENEYVVAIVDAILRKLTSGLDAARAQIDFVDFARASLIRITERNC
jgi:hypothetical protein